LSLLIYPLDKRNTKRLKNQKTKPADFFVKLVFQSILFKKAKITKSLFMKNSRNNNIILGFSVWFYVFDFSCSNG